MEATTEFNYDDRLLKFESGFNKSYHSESLDEAFIEESWYSYKQLCKQIRSSGEIVLVGLSDDGLHYRLDKNQKLLSEIIGTKYSSDVALKGNYIVPFIFVKDGCRFIINEFLKVQREMEVSEQEYNHLSGYGNFKGDTSYVRKRNIDTSQKGLSDMKEGVKANGKQLFHIHKMTEKYGAYQKVCLVLVHRLFLSNADCNYKISKRILDFVLTFFPSLLLPSILYIANNYIGAIAAFCVSTLIFGNMIKTAKEWLAPLVELNKDHYLFFCSLNDEPELWMKCVMKVFSYDERNVDLGIERSNFFIYPFNKKVKRGYSIPFILPEGHREWGVILINQIVRNLEFNYWNLPFYESFRLRRIKTNMYEHIRDHYYNALTNDLINEDEFDVSVYLIDEMQDKQNVKELMLSEDEMVFTILSEIEKIADHNKFSTCRIWEDDVYELLSNSNKRTKIEPLGNTIYILQCHKSKSEIIDSATEMIYEIFEQNTIRFRESLKIRLICICSADNNSLSKYRKNQKDYVGYVELFKGKEINFFLKKFENISVTYSYDFSVIESDMGFNDVLRYLYNSPSADEVINDYTNEENSSENTNGYSIELTRRGYEINEQSLRQEQIKK